MTLDELGAQVGVAGSHLSLIENGKREPKLSLLQEIARATGTELGELLSPAPPNRRAALEIELERAQASTVFRRLGAPAIKVTKGMSDETIESVSPSTASWSAASGRRSRRRKRRVAPTRSCACACAATTTTSPTSSSSPRSSFARQATPRAL